MIFILMKIHYRKKGFALGPTKFWKWGALELGNGSLCMMLWSVMCRDRYSDWCCLINRTMIGRTGTDGLELPRNKLLIHDVLSIPLASDASLKFKKAFNTYFVIILENKEYHRILWPQNLAGFSSVKLHFGGEKTDLASGKLWTPSKRRAVCSVCCWLSYKTICSFRRFEFKRLLFFPFEPWVLIGICPSVGSDHFLCVNCLCFRQTFAVRPGAINCVKVVVEFHPWFKLYFPLYQTHCHTPSYPKTKENII